MKGGFGCSPCCGPTCDECTRECTNPHTGDPFEVYYTYKFEGVEAGNPGQVATGDADSSDPYDGMDGTGPWEQKVSFGFELTSSTTRHPCSVLVSFWRSNFVLGAATNPPPSAALTLNEITITNNGSSADGPVIVGFEVLNPGESKTFEGQIPLVAGSGDQSENDPRSGSGTVGFTQACGNQRAKVDITATIRWATQKRQHILYGIVRECYEDPDNPPECGSPCSAQNPPPNVMYVTISNVAFAKPAGLGTPYDWLDDPITHTIAGTYVVERHPNLCASYDGLTLNECGSSANPPYNILLLFDSDQLPFVMQSDRLLETSSGTVCTPVTLYLEFGSVSLRQNCDTLPISGSGGVVFLLGLEVGTFDWSIDD